MYLPDAVYGPEPVSARRLWALVSELPPGSAVARLESAGWTTDHELLASLIEVLDAGMRNLFVAALAPYSKKTPEPWAAVTVPRPGQPAPQIEPPAPKRAPLSVAEIKARFMEAGGDG